jgi:hypothetical protein
MTSGVASKHGWNDTADAANSLSHARIRDDAGELLLPLEGSCRNRGCNCLDSSPRGLREALLVHMDSKKRHMVSLPTVTWRSDHNPHA